MSISPELTQVSDVQNNETGFFKSLIEVFIDQSNLYVGPVILQGEKFFYLKGQETSKVSSFNNLATKKKWGLEFKVAAMRR